MAKPVLHFIAHSLIALENLFETYFLDNACLIWNRRVSKRGKKSIRIQVFYNTAGEKPNPELLYKESSCLNLIGAEKILCHSKRQNVIWKVREWGKSSKLLKELFRNSKSFIKEGNGPKNNGTVLVFLGCVAVLKRNSREASEEDECIRFDEIMAEEWWGGTSFWWHSRFGLPWGTQEHERRGNHCFAEDKGRERVCVCANIFIWTCVYACVCFCCLPHMLSTVTTTRNDKSPSQCHSCKSKPLARDDAFSPPC